MNKVLKVLGAVAGAYLLFDAGAIFGIGIMKDVYEGDITLDPNKKLDRVFANCMCEADKLYTKVLG